MGAQQRIYRRRIKTVQSTKKITKAMELIASSRIVKAQFTTSAGAPLVVNEPVAEALDAAEVENLTITKVKG